MTKTRTCLVFIDESVLNPDPSPLGHYGLSASKFICAKRSPRFNSLQDQRHHPLPKKNVATQVFSNLE